MTVCYRFLQTKLLAAAILACAQTAQAATRPEIPVWNAAALEKDCDRTLKAARTQMTALERLPASKTAASRVFRAWDRLQMTVENNQGPVELLANVSPDPATRDAGEKCQLKFTAFVTDLLQNEKIYARFRQVEPGDAIDRKLKQDVSEDFEERGVALPPEKRARMKAILQRMEEVRQAFARNVRDNKTRLAFTPEETRGLPGPYLEKARRDDKGNYLLGFDYPEYEPFMANAENEEARHRYLIAFSNRGTKENLALLREAGRLSREIAQLFGLPSYAHYATRRKMVGNPETAQRFLDQVKAKVREIELREFAELRALKAQRLGKGIQDVSLNRWDIPYYQERLKQARYSVDQEALRAYFPTDATVQWALEISSRLYGVKFVPAKPPVWHESVRYVDVVDARNGRFLSGIYLDLFPREGKYSHAAAFGVRSASTAANRTPISVLVANLNRKGLDFREVETLLHEFGHILHGVLSRTRYAGQGGTNVERDFVEAPSQMFEEWARKKDSLQLLARICGGCPAIDDALLKRLRAARLYGAGTRYARQHLYAAYDLALTGERELDPMQTWIAMERESPAGHVPGTEFPGSFGHLVSGYSAGYYGYMWSEVLALDMLSEFGDNLMNPTVGRRFRDAILSQGGQKRGADMVRKFLGRDPSPQAFFAEITGQRSD